MQQNGVVAFGLAACVSLSACEQKTAPAQAPSAAQTPTGEMVPEAKAGLEPVPHQDRRTLIIPGRSVGLVELGKPISKEARAHLGSLSP